MPPHRAVPTPGNHRRQAVDALRALIAGLRQSEHAVERQTGVTNAQLFVLQRLSEAGTLSVNDLASLALTHQSTVSVVVSRLERAGLVDKVRSAADARRAVISITAAGRRLLRNAPPAPLYSLWVALDGLPPADRRALARGLGALVRAMKIDVDRPPLLFEDPAPRKPVRRRTAR